MILVDTSVWVAHFRKHIPELADALGSGHVLMHKIVLGELACGNLLQRQRSLQWLQALPKCQAVSDSEALAFIEWQHLHGKGIGWNDVQLLAAAHLQKVKFWSMDKALHNAAKTLKLAY